MNKRILQVIITLILLSVLLSCTSLQSYPISRVLQDQNRIIAEKTLPVVVEISTVEVKKQGVPQSRGWPWDFLFPEEEQETPENPKEREFRTQGLGSGVIVKREQESFYVITNYHVIEKADEIFVRLQAGQEFPALVRGFDKRKDLALLVVEKGDPSVPVAVLGDSDTLKAGDIVFALGSPFGYTSSITMGIVSALHRAGPTEVSDFIQTDASINQGNSGGALVNLKGEVVGINTWITTPTGGNIGLGFSIPINGVKRVLEDLILYGEVRYGWLGVSVSNLDDRIARDLKSSTVQGALVSQVFFDSPAYGSNLLPGDIIISLDKDPVTSSDQLIVLIGQKSPGDTVKLGLLRGGEVITLSIILESRKRDEELLSAPYWPGISAYPLTEVIREELELTKELQGVVLYDVLPGTASYKAGLRPDDIILSINDKPVNNLLDFYQTLNDKNNIGFTFEIFRNGRILSLKISKEEKGSL